MGENRHRSYRDLLIRLSDLIDQRSLEAMKFRCDGLIGSREREKINSPIQLWSALEKRECIGEFNLQFLKELLRSCMGGQLEAVSLVENYERMSTTQEHQQMNGHSGNVFRPYTPIQPPQIQFFTQDTHASPRHGNQQQATVLQNEMMFLSASLGRDWAFYIRELEVPDSEIDMVRMDYRFTRDQIYQCLLVWQNLNKQNATKQRLIAALREVKRNDLAASMERGDY